MSWGLSGSWTARHYKPEPLKRAAYLGRVLRRSMTPPKKTGVKHKIPSLDQIIRATKTLEKANLITRKSSKNYLIFSCNLAASKPSFTSKKVAPFLAPLDSEIILEKTETYTSKIKKAAPKVAPNLISTNYINTNVFILCKFEEFWTHYPIKQNKKKALEIWKRKKLNDLAPRIIADIQQRKVKHRPWIEGYIPHPTTYLNGERWADDIQEVSNAATFTSNQYTQRQAAAISVFEACQG
jgi:hypothetical protein